MTTPFTDIVVMNMRDLKFEDIPYIVDLLCSYAMEFGAANDTLFVFQLTDELQLKFQATDIGDDVGIEVTFFERSRGDVAGNHFYAHQIPSMVGWIWRRYRAISKKLAEIGASV